VRRRKPECVRGIGGSILGTSIRGEKWLRKTEQRYKWELRV